MLKQYYDILARVRGDGKWHSIRSLVQPDDPQVIEVAAILARSDNFVAACQNFVDSFTTYAREVGDYWSTPAETMVALCPLCLSDNVVRINSFQDIYRCNDCGYVGEPTRAGDCDDKAILLTSLLRYRLPADEVYCAFGAHRLNRKAEGHMWVIKGNGLEDTILEATAPYSAELQGEYELMAFFNDKYAFSYPEGIREFNLAPVEEESYAAT